MRLATFFALLIFGFACGPTKNATTSSGKLNGTWLPVQQELNGRMLPKAMIEKQKLIISDSNYTVIAESVDKGIVKYAGDKMDIYSREGVNKGKHFTAIYKLEGSQLTVCYNLAGDGYPAAFESKSKPMLFLAVFTKEQ